MYVKELEDTSFKTLRKELGLWGAIVAWFWL